MASITLKNIPEELMDSLRRRAERNRRSLLKEILYLLEVGVRSAGPGMGSVARESTAAYGTDTRGRGAELTRERQVEVWRELCGTWESDESVAEEIEAIYRSRSMGREVEL